MHDNKTKELLCVIAAKQKQKRAFFNRKRAVTDDFSDLFPNGLKVFGSGNRVQRRKSIKKEKKEKEDMVERVLRSSRDITVSFARPRVLLRRSLTVLLPFPFALGMKKKRVERGRKWKVCWFNKKRKTRTEMGNERK